MNRAIFLVLVIAAVLFSNSNSIAGDSPEETKAKIRSAYDLFNSKDFGNLGIYIAEDVIDHTPAIPNLAFGLKGVMECANLHYSAFPDFNFTINELIVEGNKAAVHFTFEGTNTGEFFGMPATNKKVKIDGIEILVFENGKAKERWGFVDTQKMMEQLGMATESK